MGLRAHSANHPFPTPPLAKWDTGGRLPPRFLCTSWSLATITWERKERQYSHVDLPVWARRITEWV